MSSSLVIGERPLGNGSPTFVVAEVGINHNGDIQLAKRLIDVAFGAGCDAVKFQKRTPESWLPTRFWDIQRDTPWGIISNIEYRRRLELGLDQYSEISSYCKSKPIAWFASCWDLEAVDFISSFDPPCYKVPSPCLTSNSLLRAVRSKGRPIVLSTGMSTIQEIDHAVSILGQGNLVLLQCTSVYPTPVTEINLQVITEYRRRYGCLVGYSGHEEGYVPTLAAVVLGACYVERHLTLDRSMRGSDQAASIEPNELSRLVQGIRAIEAAMGTGHKEFLESEQRALARFRTFELP